MIRSFSSRSKYEGRLISDSAVTAVIGEANAKLVEFVFLMTIAPSKIRPVFSISNPDIGF